MIHGRPTTPGGFLASRLAARLAHDLNNVIAVLGGHLSLLRRGGQDPQESYDEMGKSLEQLERMSLRLGRLGGLGVEGIRPFDLNALVGALIEEMGVIVRLDLAENLPPISGRRTDAAAALRELLENASRAVVSGGEILVETRWVAESASVLLIVEDSGTGLDPAVRERLFEPFFSSAGRRGEGLGLTVVEAAVREQGGSCEILQRPEGGTRAILRLRASRSGETCSEPRDFRGV